MSIYARCAEELRQAAHDLAKNSRAVERREAAHFASLQVLKSVADVLAGDVEILPPQVEDPRPQRTQRVIRDGNVIEIGRTARWPGSPTAKARTKGGSGSAR